MSLDGTETRLFTGSTDGTVKVCLCVCVCVCVWDGEGNPVQTARDNGVRKYLDAHQ